MKNKYAAIVLGLALTISSCPVYAAENTTEATTNAENSSEAETTSDSEAEENTVLGQVTAVNDDSITIAIGTQKEMQAPVRHRTVMAISRLRQKNPTIPTVIPLTSRLLPKNRKAAPRKALLKMIRFPLIAAPGKLQKLRTATVLPMKMDRGSPPCWI